MDGGTGIRRGRRGKKKANKINLSQIKSKFGLKALRLTDGCAASE